ncbi:hypothetical protein H5410_014990 [Solanum commersonii]|uniref:Uncharacterized protein n=1 Tax=Solanum commersonii TaxID=4109 RepID=A0A9J5ZSG4_SOLCO|nr:hypothetical protein H5410_014990 [Solanum commersonii]
MPKSNFLEMKPFESSRKCAAKGHSGQLVEIADALDVPHFDFLHRFLGLCALELLVRFGQLGDSPNGLGNRQAVFFFLLSATLLLFA